MRNLFKFVLIFLFNCNQNREFYNPKKPNEASRENINKNNILILKSSIQEEDSTISLEWNKLYNIHSYNVYVFHKALSENSYTRYLLKGSVSKNTNYYTFSFKRNRKEEKVFFYQIEAVLNTVEKVLSNKIEVRFNKNIKSNNDGLNEKPNFSRERKKDLEKKKAFNPETLSKEKNILYFREKAILFDMFKFRELLKGFEIYGKDYSDEDLTCDIACINNSNKLTFFISNTTIKDPNTPIEAYPHLGNKNLDELTPQEKTIKQNLKIEGTLIKRGSDYPNSSNVIPKDTKFIIIKNNDYLYFQNIERLEVPKITKSIFEQSELPLNKKSKLFVKWDKVKGAKDYKIAIKSAVDGKVFTECVQTNKIIIELDIDPKLDNEFNILRLVALNDNFESAKASGDIELTKPNSFKDQRESLNKFLSKYNVHLDKEIEKDLLSLPAVRKGKIELEDSKLDFTKILILSLCDNKKIKIRNLSNYNSEVLNKLLEREIEEKVNDNEIYNYFLKELKNIYKKASSGSIELFKNEDHPNYTINDYIFNCALGVASALSLFEIKTSEELGRNKCFENIIREIKLDRNIKVNEHILPIGTSLEYNSKVTLFSKENRKSIRNYCLDIYYLLQEESNIQEKEHYLKLFIEGFSNCSSGIFERLAYISNSLFLKQNNSKNNYLEEIVENILLQFREDLFKRKIMAQLKSLNRDFDENVMYMNWIRKGVSKELKLFPADYNAILLERNFLKPNQSSKEFYRSFIEDFKTLYYNEIVEKVEKELNSDKGKILHMLHAILRENFLYLGQDEEATTLFFRRHLVKKDRKKEEIITANFVRALLAKKGILVF